MKLLRLCKSRMGCLTRQRSLSAAAMRDGLGNPSYLVVILIGCFTASAAEEDAHQILETYCADCHDEDLKKGASICINFSILPKLMER